MYWISPVSRDVIETQLDTHRGRGNSVMNKGMINISFASSTSISLTQAVCPSTAAPRVSVLPLRGVYIIMCSPHNPENAQNQFPGSNKHARDQCGVVEAQVGEMSHRV